MPPQSLVQPRGQNIQVQTMHPRPTTQQRTGSQTVPRKQVQRAPTIPPLKVPQTLEVPRIRLLMLARPRTVPKILPLVTLVLPRNLLHVSCHHVSRHTHLTRLLLRNLLDVFLLVRNRLGGRGRGGE